MLLSLIRLSCRVFIIILFFLIYKNSVLAEVYRYHFGTYYKKDQSGFWVVKVNAAEIPKNATHTWVSDNTWWGRGYWSVHVPDPPQQRPAQIQRPVPPKGPIREELEKSKQADEAKRAAKALADAQATGEALAKQAIQSEEHKKEALAELEKVYKADLQKMRTETEESRKSQFEKSLNDLKDFAAKFKSDIEMDIRAIGDKAKTEREASACRIKALCFPGETLVSVKDNSSDGFHDVPISTIHVGDLVISCTLESAEKICEVGKVQQVFRNTVDRLVHVSFSGRTVRATDNHPFYVLDRNNWIEAKDLQLGNRLLSITGNVVTINDLSIETGEFVVYNLDVQGSHNYYACGVLVHNCDFKERLAQLPATTVLGTAAAVVGGAAEGGVIAGPLGTMVGSAAALGYVLHKATAPDFEQEGDSAGVDAAPKPTAPKNPVEELLGEGALVKTNKHGDKVFISKDGKTKVRFDVNESHGDDPHMHVEKQSSTGKWKDAFDEHRFYPGKKE